MTIHSLKVLYALNRTAGFFNKSWYTFKPREYFEYHDIPVNLK